MLQIKVCVTPMQVADAFGTVVFICMGKKGFVLYLGKKTQILNITGICSYT